MEKAHSRIKWENYPSIATPLNETNLNKMDIALDEVDNRVLGLDTAKLDKATANTMVKDVSFVEATGIFTVTLLDGTTKTFDTKLEKIATNFRYDYATQMLLITLADGTEQQVDLSSLISNYEFVDSDIIAFTFDSDGKLTANIKDGTVTENKLQPNFLADVKTEVAKAKSHSDGAYDNAVISSTASQEAKTYRDEAKQFRDETEAMSGVSVATTQIAGIVKPDGTTITVDADGTIHADNGTVDYTELQNKPTINGVEITGDLTSDDLNIVAGDNAVYLTQAEYDALPDSKLTDDVEYRITDAGTDEVTASNVSYDNSVSGLDAITTQQAIDKVSESLDNMIKKEIISSTTTGGFGNVSLYTIPLSCDILSVYLEGYVCIPRRTASAWTCIIFSISNGSPELTVYKNQTVTNLTVVYVER